MLAFVKFIKNLFSHKLIWVLTNKRKDIEFSKFSLLLDNIEKETQV